MEDFVVIDETYFHVPERFWWNFLCDILDGKIEVIKEESDDIYD